MPWEIDYALLTFNQLKKSSYHIGGLISKEDTITIDSVLNLSSYLINWKKSKLPKEYFIEKYNTYSLLLDDNFIHNKKIYDGDELYGHLDLQRDCVGKNIDWYMSICPDLYFSETLLAKMIGSFKALKNNYQNQKLLKEKTKVVEGRPLTNPHIVITPCIFRMWDYTWDEIVHPMFEDVPYDQWDTAVTQDVRASYKFNEYNKLIERTGEREIISLKEVQSYLKWTGWFDAYSKDLYEKIILPPKEWKGYGPWDLFSMNVSSTLNNNLAETGEGVLFKQFIVDEVISKWSLGPLRMDKKEHSGNWLQHPIKQYLYVNKRGTKEKQRNKIVKDGDPLRQMNRKNGMITKRCNELKSNKKLWKSIYTKLSSTE